jgi:hypothetical protein
MQVKTTPHSSTFAIFYLRATPQEGEFKQAPAKIQG